MNNPWYDRINGVSNPQVTGYAQPVIPVNPVQRMSMAYRAMANPAAFLKQRFPDIPDGIMNDPNQILGYLQQSRGITDEQVRKTRESIPTMGW